jgi:radical SAM protein with 4Fe4S-binding SPASM domain
MFKFLKKHRFVAHPMITKNFVMNYKENYDFWIDNIIKYDCSYEKNGKKIYNIPMFLEVRDPDQWDSEDALKQYREFLLYVAEKDLSSYHNTNLEEFAMHVADDFSDSMQFLGLYNKTRPYIINIPEIYSAIPCSIQSGLKCRVGDMALVPCHRTCYPNMIFGNFITNDDNTEIIGAIGDKVNLAHKIQTCNPNRSFLRCSNCNIKAFCLKGCLGSQYENTGELFGAQDNICKLFKTKYRTVHEICEKYGIYDIITNNISIPIERREHINYVKNIISEL